MSMRGAEGMIYTDLGLSLLGVCCWLIVGILWRDRALIMVNAIGLSLLMSNLINLLMLENLDL